MEKPVWAESGTFDMPRTMSTEELPDDTRRIKGRCCINRYEGAGP